MFQDKLSFGRCYHIYFSGDPKQAIFRLEEDYYSFLDQFRIYVNPIVHLYAYCLLPTHFHLLLRIKDKIDIEYVYSQQEMLLMQFSNLFDAYTRYFKQRYQLTDRVFNGRVSRQVPRRNKLICDLIAYIHQNPQIHGIVSDFRNWPFSSCFAYLRQDRRSMIAKELLLDPECRQRILNLQNAPRLQVMEPGMGFYRRNRKD